MSADSSCLFNFFYSNTGVSRHFRVGGTSTDTSSALVGMHFEGAEQKVMGIQTSAQMIGVVNDVCERIPAKSTWEATFWAHILVAPLIVVLICLPMDKPMRNTGGKASRKG